MWLGNMTRGFTGCVVGKCVRHVKACNCNMSEVTFSSLNENMCIKSQRTELKHQELV